MNARSQVLELEVESRQIDEAVLSLFHTLILYRSSGKFIYENGDKYRVGSVGFQDVDCEYIDFTYVKCSSDQLNAALKTKVSNFTEAIKSSSSGQVALEFFQRKKTRLPFILDSIPWEVWTLNITYTDAQNESERLQWREKVGCLLGERLLVIIEALNKHNYTPSPPTSEDLDLIYDTSYPDVQPYLFKVNYSLSSPSNPSVSSAVKKILSFA